MFDEYTRRQYQAKAPQRNPFGDEEEPNKFADFDIVTKIRVLHQLSIWTLNNPNPIREKMAEVDETQWVSVEIEDEFKTLRLTRTADRTTRLGCQRP